MLLDRRLLKYFDHALLGLTLLIPCLGLIVLYSAGLDLDGPQPAFSWLPFEFSSPAFARQILFMSVGLGLMLVAALIPTQFLLRYSYPIYGVVLALLAIVLAMGSIAKGAQRWIDLGPISFQPSEMMKPALIFAMARYLSRHPPASGGYGFMQLIVPFLIFGVPMLLIIAQPDLGTALAIGAVGMAMVLFMGIRIKSLLLMALSLVAAALPAWQFVLHDYQKRRVMVLFNPDADPLGSGYHIIQSKIAVGSGGLFGKGFLHGTQTQLEFLPEHTTDFIFSVLGEEWGFMGSALVVMLYGVLVYRMLRIVSRSNDLFAGLLAFGVSAQIFFNAAINIGMVIGLLPVVGLPLPLFSYGGTSLLSSMFAIGMVLGVGMRRLQYLVN